MGAGDGSIIATSITIHIPMNDGAAPGHGWPGSRIHVIDIVQPPGISIPPIADIDADNAIVIATLAAKSSTETPRKRVTTTSISLSACRIRRDGATRGRSRCALWVRGQATGTCPTGHRVPEHKSN